MTIKTKVGLKPETLSFDGEFFKDVRNMLNIVMNEGVKTICQKGTETGTLTLKLKIQMKKKIPRTLLRQAHTSR